MKPRLGRTRSVKSLAGTRASRSRSRGVLFRSSRSITENTNCCFEGASLETVPEVRTETWTEMGPTRLARRAGSLRVTCESWLTCLNVCHDSCESTEDLCSVGDAVGLKVMRCADEITDETEGPRRIREAHAWSPRVEPTRGAEDHVAHARPRVLPLPHCLPCSEVQLRAVS
jgi:hypothetical protein